MGQALDHGHEAVVFRGGGDLYPGPGLGQEVFQPVEPALPPAMAQHHGFAGDVFAPGPKRG